MEKKENIVRDAKILAFKAVKKEFRRSLGKYYLLWSTYSIINYSIVFLLNYLNITSALPYIIFYSIIFSFYIYFSTRFFILSNQAYYRFYSIYYSEEKSKKTRSSLVKAIRSVFIYTASFAFVSYAFYVSNILLQFLAFLIFSILVILGLRYPYKIAGIKYYDVLSIITFVIEINLSFLSYILESIIFTIFSISWIFAGYKSLTEVGDDNEL
jgi:hypothetical protein